MSNQMTVRPQNGQIAVSRQGIAGTEIEMRRETAAVAIAQRARAEVEARYQVALYRPRSTDEARARILAHCRRPSFAEGARYAKPIGKEKVIGPSIRFVEAALQEYGNVLVSCNVVWDDANERRVEVSVTDLERNISYPKEIVLQKTVERRSGKGREVLGTRINSWGDTIYIVAATEDDLQVKQGALESKAIRTLGLRILPADIVAEAMEVVADTVANEDAKDPDEARKRLVDAFQRVGIYPVMLAEYLGGDLGAASPAQLAELRIVYATLSAGEATWRDLLELKLAERAPGSDGDEAAAPTKGQSRAAAALESRRARRKAKKAQAAKAAEESAAPGPDQRQAVETVEAPAEEVDAMAEGVAHAAEGADELDAKVAEIRAELEGGNVSDEVRAEIMRLPIDEQAELAELFDAVAKGQPGKARV